MAIQLYDISVGSYLQIVGAFEGVLAKGLEHFKANGVDPNEVVESRMIADMLPFKFQVAAVAHHSLGAIKGIQGGVFTPPSEIPSDYAGLQKLIADTHAGLKALTPAEVNACEGRDVLFQMRNFKIPFVAEGFIQSFSLPNLHFHATTAYDILRMKGVKLGKQDYLGTMRIKAQ